jgi:hypothetical protein
MAARKERTKKRELRIQNQYEHELAEEIRTFAHKSMPMKMKITFLALVVLLLRPKSNNAFTFLPSLAQRRGAIGWTTSCTSRSPSFRLLAEGKNSSEISHEEVEQYRSHLTSRVTNNNNNERDVRILVDLFDVFGTRDFAAALDLTKHSRLLSSHEQNVVDVVMKFGGSSIADKDRVDHVARLIKDQIAAGYRPRAVVCSAMGKTTNSLLSAGDFALGTCIDQ